MRPMGCINGAVRIAFYAVVMLLVLSCASFSSSGVGRVKRYTIESERLPKSFDGYTVAFVSDIHYPSLFTRARLGKLVDKLRDENPSILLLGGDYVTDNSCLDELFDSISAVPAKDGLYAVLGNHEVRNSSLVSATMQEHGVRLLCDEVVLLAREGDTIALAGVKDSFKRDSVFASSLGIVSDKLFTMLLSHTPDYAERNAVATDVVLSGHTHGGQVSLLGMYTPVKNSAYGKRFIRGRNKTTGGTEVITTNGVGTSRKKIRFCVPSEIVVLVLRRSCN